MHHLDLTSKLPWLKDKLKTKAEESEESGGCGDSQPTEKENRQHTPHETDTVPDHPQKTTPTNHTPNPLEIEFEDENDGNEWDLLPPLPPKDYYDQSPSLPDLPPRDYPIADQIQSVERTGDLISDDDYYAQMMNALNS